MNSSASTNQTRPATAGSNEVFLTGLAPDGSNNLLMNGQPWVLVSASVILVDPNGNLTNIPATGTNGGLTWSAPWTVAAAPAGTWARAWTCTDAAGVTQFSQPLYFKVIASPVG